MTLKHGRNCSIFLNGVDISGDLNEVNPTSEQELADVTTFGCVGHTFYPGLAKDTGTISGMYSSTSQTVINALRQTDPGYGMMIAFGQSIGDPAYCCNEVMLMNHSIKSVVTDVNRISFNFDVDNYPFEPGFLLTAGKDNIVGFLGVGTTVNTGYETLSSSRGAAYFQFFGSSTGGSVTVSIQSSSTGAFAGEQNTTCTFAATSDWKTGSTQRVAISTTIHQYARCAWTDTASGSTIAVALVKYSYYL